MHTSVGSGVPVAQILEFSDSNVKVMCSNPYELTTGKIRDEQYLSTGYKIQYMLYLSALDIQFMAINAHLLKIIEH